MRFSDFNISCSYKIHSKIESDFTHHVFFSVKPDIPRIFKSFISFTILHPTLDLKLKVLNDLYKEREHVPG